MLAGISSDVPAKVDRVASLVGSLLDRVGAISLVPDRVIASQEEFSLISRDHVATIMRQAIGDTLRPVLEASMGKSEQHNEAILAQLQDIRSSAAAAIGSQMMVSTSGSETMGHPVTSAPGREHRAIPRFKDHGGSQIDEERTSSGLLGHVTSKDAIAQVRPELLEVWSSWAEWPGLGSIRFEVKTFIRSGRWFFTVAIDFWPSWSLLFRKRAISLLYTSRPNNQGYYHICPLVAVYPIIPYHNPVWDAIWKDDVLQIQKLFDAGLASPFDEDSLGGTLIQVM